MKCTSKPYCLMIIMSQRNSQESYLIVSLDLKFMNVTILNKSIFFSRFLFFFNKLTLIVLFTGKNSPLLPLLSLANLRLSNLNLSFYLSFITTVWANSRQVETICKWRNAKLTQGKNNPWCSKLMFRKRY